MEFTIIARGPILRSLKTNNYNFMCKNVRGCCLLLYSRSNAFVPPKCQPIRPYIGVERLTFPTLPNSGNCLLKQERFNEGGNVGYFHTSSARKAIPVLGPLLIKLASPLSRLAAILLGRQLRKWWRNLPEKHRVKLFNDARKRGDKILIAIFGTLGICFGYYSYHLEENSITGRKQLMIMNEHQIKEIAEKELMSLKKDLEGLIVQTDHPNHIRVSKVARRILQYNPIPEIINKSWRVNVVDSEMVNAFVLPNGDIFVMNGMLKTVASDDELAGILGHEMAHAILNHPAEQLSFSGFASIFNLIILTLLWTVVPSDGLAIFFNWIESMLQDILIHLPYQRDLEKEADCVGLYLAARACFDVRKISDFWERMDKLEEGEERAEWLSTHPSHSKRADWIRDWMPQALEMRKANNCPEIIPFYDRVKQFLGF